MTFDRYQLSFLLQAPRRASPSDTGEKSAQEVDAGVESSVRAWRESQVSPLSIPVHVSWVEKLNRATQWAPESHGSFQEIQPGQTMWPADSWGFSPSLIRMTFARP